MAGMVESVSLVGPTEAILLAEFDGMLSVESGLRKSISESDYLTMLSASLTVREGGADSGVGGGGGAGGGGD